MLQFSRCYESRFGETRSAKRGWVGLSAPPLPHRPAAGMDAFLVTTPETKVLMHYRIEKN